MKLATLKRGGRDGTFLVVDRSLRRSVAVPAIARTLQAALEDWERCAPALQAVYERLNAGEVSGAFDLDAEAIAAPLPRAYQWLDASAYLTHVERVRKARGATLPPELYSDPLMYQGISDCFLGAHDPVPVQDEDWGIDFEGEVAIVTDDVPMAVAADEAVRHIKLILLVNDVSLRNLIPGEIAKGFGFVHSKPASACSPVAVTPDELGAAWDGAKVHLPLRVQLNGERFGEPNAGDDMAFAFSDLIAHAAKTRRLGAGTVIGSGTVSNAERARGFSCIAERRVVEFVENGRPVTPFMRFGDRVRIEMLAADGASIFGAIDQKIVRFDPRQSN